MPRYIDADRLIAKFYLDDYRCYDWSEILSIIIDENITPTEDVQPVVHAKWVFVSQFHDEEIYRCSNCHEPSCEEFLYCPSCGTKMDKE